MSVSNANFSLDTIFLGDELKLKNLEFKNKWIYTSTQPLVFMARTEKSLLLFTLVLLSEDYCNETCKHGNVYFSFPRRHQHIWCRVRNKEVFQKLAG